MRYVALRCVALRRLAVCGKKRRNMPHDAATQLIRRERRFKPRPHQQQCPSNIVECYKLNDSFDNVECCFDIVAVFGNNVERNFVLSTKSKQIKHVPFVSTKDEISFDIVTETGNIVAKNGNNVEATFDFVERTNFYDKLVRHCCRMATKCNVALTKSNVASTMLPVVSTLLLVWTGL